MAQSDARVEVLVIGGGYVGYPLAVIAASAGMAVTVVDIDRRVVADINAGRPRIADEPGLLEAALVAHHAGLLRASPVPVPSRTYVIAVPTPVAADGRSPDLTLVVSAAESIVPTLAPGATVIVESTVPPGTCEGIVLPILESGGLDVGSDLSLAHCPERVLPGQTLDELRFGERIIGGFDAASVDAARSFYRAFSKGELIETDLITAEFCKLMENTYRDVNIALANQIAELAQAHGIDVVEAIRIANGHPRVEYLSPGIGVGGHCIPVDPWFLVSKEDIDDGLIGEARAINDRQPSRIAARIAAFVDGAERAEVLLIGAAYKQDVIDMRNSPSLGVAEALRTLGVGVRLYDPLVSEYAGDLGQLANGVDALVVLVPHRVVLAELAERETEIRARMRKSVLLDATRGLLRPLML